MPLQDCPHLGLDGALSRRRPAQIAARRRWAVEELRRHLVGNPLLAGQDMIEVAEEGVRRLLRRHVPVRVPPAGWRCANASMRGVPSGGPARKASAIGSSSLPVAVAARR